jgi:hypothetical protein
LKQPAAGGGAEPRSSSVHPPRSAGAYHASATIEPSAFQDLAEVLPDLLKITAGMPLKFNLSVTLGDGQEVGSSTLDTVNQLLGEVSADLRLAR